MAESWMTPVLSSNVSAIGYDSDSGEMLVKWKSGKTSAYAGVSEGMALDAAAGHIASVGQWLNREIKNNYPHRYV